ncbi:MAG: hypothetical protein MZU79_07035 [Anaerotruncus sp.]|nr:hypothetical protein [Anaerotruncus sp.]
MQTLADGLILYSPKETSFVKAKNRSKISYANNTINYLVFPEIGASREEIKREYGIPFKKTALFVGRMDVGGGLQEGRSRDRGLQHHREPRLRTGPRGLGIQRPARKGDPEGNVLYLGEIYDPGNVEICKIFKMADVFPIPGHVGLGHQSGLRPGPAGDHGKGPSRRRSTI